MNVPSLYPATRMDISVITQSGACDILVHFMGALSRKLVEQHAHEV